MEGWIKIHRKILGNPIVCKDSDHFAIWTYLLLNASHKEMSVLFKGEKIKLEPGQIITGRIEIANFLSISESKVKRILIEFESDQQIERQRSNQNSLITIVKWGTYQDTDQQNDQPVDSQWTASDQPNKTKKSDQKKINIQECKELKESNINVTKEKATRFIPPTIEEVKDYCNERGNSVDSQRFIDFYASKGWYVGKNKMKDWKAAVRTWEQKQAPIKNEGESMDERLRRITQ